MADSVAQLPQLVGLIGEMRDELRGLRGDLDALPEGIDDVNRGLASMQKDIRGLRADLEALPAGIDVMSRDLGEVLENVRPMDEDLADVEKAVRELAPRLEGMRLELDRLRSDLAGLPFVSKS